MAEPTMFDEVTEGARILLAPDIRNLVRSRALIAPFVAKNLAACAYDFSAGSKAVVAGGTEFDLHKTPLVLGPGSYAGLISHEKVALPPNILVHLGPKKRLSYEGMILLSGSVIDPGYEGHLLFVLFNSSGSKRVIGIGRKICCGIFYQLDKGAEELVGRDPELADGSFPQDFLNSMANMELPSLIELSQKLQGISALELRMATLEKKYTDVTEPINKLVESVKQVTRDVAALTEQGKQVLGRIAAHERRLTKHGVWLVVAWTLIVILLTGLITPLLARLFNPA